MKTKLKIALVLIALGLLYIAGFVHGQLYEAKELLKFDLSHALHLHKMANKPDAKAVKGMIELQIKALTASYEARIQHPIRYYVSQRDRRIVSDASMAEELSGIHQQVESFESGNLVGSPPIEAP